MKKQRAVALAIIMFLHFAAVAYLLPVEAITPVNDQDYAPTVIKLIQSARSNIKVMLYQARYYEEYPGSFSNEMADELVRARKRGVYVVAIVERADWNKENTKWNEQFAKNLAAGGVEIYMDPLDVTSHQKVMLVDNEVTVVGSTNWSHYSLTKNNEAGVVVWSREVNKAFQDYFNERLGEATIYEETLTTPVLEKRFCAFLPQLKARNLKLLNNRDYFPEVHKALSGAKKSIRVIQMEALYYMVPPKWEGVELKPGEPQNPTNQFLLDFVDAKNRGVDVKVILDVQSNRRNVNEDFANRLLARGVEVYYDDPTTTTHAKMLLVDDDITIIGSTNWSYPALAVGNEASVLIESPEVNKKYEQYFQRIMQTSKPVGSYKPTRLEVERGKE